MTDKPDILKKILARKVEEIAERSRSVSMRELQQQAAAADAPRGFINALQQKNRCRADRGNCGNQEGLSEPGCVA